MIHAGYIHCHKIVFFASRLFPTPFPYSIPPKTPGVRYRDGTTEKNKRIGRLVQFHSYRNHPHHRYSDRYGWEIKPRDWRLFSFISSYNVTNWAKSPITQKSYLQSFDIKHERTSSWNKIEVQGSFLLSQIETAELNGEKLWTGSFSYLSHPFHNTGVWSSE